MKQIGVGRRRARAVERVPRLAVFGPLSQEPEPVELIGVGRLGQRIGIVSACRRRTPGEASGETLTASALAKCDTSRRASCEPFQAAFNLSSAASDRSCEPVSSRSI